MGFFKLYLSHSYAAPVLKPGAANDATSDASKPPLLLLATLATIS